MSLAQLGNLTGISPSYIHHIEKSERACVSALILKNIAGALGLDATLLLQIEPPDSTKPDLKLLVNMEQCTVNKRPLKQPEKDFLVTCIDAVESENWSKKKKAMFVLELLENVNRLKAEAI